MFQPIYPGRADVRFAIAEQINAGELVMLDSANPGKVKKSNGTAVYGIAGETNKVFAADFSDFRSMVKRIPAVGDKIGVWVDNGSYKTDVFVAGTYAPGTKLYVTTAGKICDSYNATASATQGSIQVGVAVKLSNGVLEFDSIL